jgi:hypothetical protein
VFHCRSAFVEIITCSAKYQELFGRSTEGVHLDAKHKYIGVTVIVLAFGPKVRGFKPGRGRWIFNGDENP